LILGLFELLLVLALPLAIVGVLWRQRFSAAPNQLIVVSGRGGLLGRGYALVRGSTFVLPLIEAAELFSLEPVMLRVSRRLRTRTGADVDVDLTATVVYPEATDALLQTVERAPTLRLALAELTEDVLVGSSAHVVATVTPEQVLKDSEAIARAIADEARYGFEALGLEVQSVTITPSPGAPFPG
jgi:uncharacterized membrane protein YqiK